MNTRRIVWLLAVGLLAGGCVEIQQAIQGMLPDTPGTTRPPGGDDSMPPDGDSNGPLGVTLRVSNTAPSVGEEVILTCNLVSGGANGVTFEFQPGNGRLIVNPFGNTAGLIINEPDIGTAFTFTCTATNDSGTSDPSNSVVIIPTG